MPYIKLFFSKKSFCSSNTEKKKPVWQRSFLLNSKQHFAVPMLIYLWSWLNASIMLSILHRVGGATGSGPNGSNERHSTSSALRASTYDIYWKGWAWIKHGLRSMCYNREQKPCKNPVLQENRWEDQGKCTWEFV